MKNLLFIFILTSFCNLSLGQSIDITAAPMSSGDKKKDFQAIGNTHFGEIALLEKSGKIWLYDGYTLNLFPVQINDNISFINSIHIIDSNLYALTDDALLQFTENKNLPIVLNKSSDHFFYGNESYYANGQLFDIQGTKIKTRSSSKIPSRYSEYITNNQDENIYLHNSQVIWSSKHDYIVAKPAGNEIQKLLVDKWDNLWALKNNKLVKLSLSRSIENIEEFRINENYPSQLKKINNAVYALYDNRLYKQITDQLTLLYTSENKILSFHIDSGNGIWIKDKLLLTYIYGSDIQQWDYNEILPNDDIIGVSNHDEILSFYFRNEGVYQTKKQDSAEQWVWVKHRMNNKLKNLNILALSQKDMDYIFSENFGIFTLEKTQLGTIRKNFPGYGIQQVVVENDKAFLLDKGKRFHIFDFGRKSISQLETEILYPEIDGINYLIYDNKIIYKATDSLVFLNYSDGSYYSWEYPFELKNAVIDHEFLYNFSQKGIRYLIPNKAETNQNPILKQLSLNTKHEKSINLNQDKSSILKLEENDFPISFSVDANYTPDPTKIEYGWFSDNSDLNQDYSFRNEIKINNPGPGEYKVKLALKYKNEIKTINVPLLAISESIVEKDYTWAIYLSAIFGSLLFIGFFYTRYRSNKQKQKIQELKWEKKTIELEQKALQLQMNPHFIFNAMNGVKGLIAQGEDKKARQYLTKISTWMRSMLQDSREEAIPIEKEISNLQTYLEIEKELRGNPWDYVINVEESVGKNHKIPPMMIQPFIENAIIHAFNKIEYRGLISISIIQKGRRLHVSIEDNGTGIQKKNNAHKSLALEVIQDRLKIFQEGTEKEFFQLINKNDIDSSTTGVLVKLILPIV